MVGMRTMINKREILEMVRHLNVSVNCLLDIAQMARERFNKLEERVRELEEAAHKHS